MKESVEITARTVDEAIKLAAEQLNIALEEIEYEVLEESHKGFLGLIGGKQARIRANRKPDKILKARKYIQNVTAKMGVITDIIVKESDDSIKMVLAGKNIGLLIGRRGETLDALQYLVNVVANKETNERKRIILDAEGYRRKREETLSQLALRLAEKVRKSGRPVALEPMNPQERRIIHTTLQDNPYVTTLSEGEEPYRKVVISLRGSRGV